MTLPWIFKPEYLFRPSQIVRRLSLGLVPPRAERVMVRTPWGWDIEVHSNEDMGKAMLHLGVYDLVVSEVIWRLTEAGETVLDLGANLGYMTALLARRTGPSGRVLSFEAHPEIAGELRANLGRWHDRAGGTRVQIHETALSDHDGTVRFEVPAQFATNRGVSRVAEANGKDEPGGHSLSIPCVRLDRILADLGPVGLAKMDVEGHEEAVLRGAQQALKGRQIRDWVFENHLDYPSPVTDLFEQAGYTVFQLQKRFIGPALVPASRPVPRSVWEPANYLATLDPDRAFTRMRGRGWNVLRAS